MLRKLKRGLSDAKEKAARNIEFAKGKTDGFEHPQQIDPFVQVVRWNKEQLPKLLKRIDALIRIEKELANAENKAYADFIVAGGHQNENPQLDQYMKAYAECQNRISELRSAFTFKIEEVRTEMKIREMKELDDLKFVYDRANKSLSDAKYWRQHSNLMKLQESEARYKQYIQEMVELLNKLVYTKETQYPGYLAKIAGAQIEFYEGAAMAAHEYNRRLKEIGNVMVRGPPHVDMNFDLGSSELEQQTRVMSTIIPSQYTTSVVPTLATTTVQSQTATPLPRNVMGIYDFVSSNPDELPFNKGDVITIHEQNGQWWVGELNGRRGLIPANYVQ